MKRPINVTRALACPAAWCGATLVFCAASHAATPRQWRDGLYLDGFAAGILTTAVFDDDGPGPDAPSLYVGGYITRLPDGTGAWGIARWDGQSWSALPPLWEGQNRAVVYSMAVYDPDDAGPELPVLVVGGVFNSQTNTGFPDLTVHSITTWNGSSWQPLGGIAEHFSEPVLCVQLGGDMAATAMCVFDDGSGPALFVGGNFRGAGDAFCNGVAKWDGSSWSELGAGIYGLNAENSYPMTMAVHDADGLGGQAPALYIGGNFLGSKPLLAKWNGSSLTSVGPNLLTGHVAQSINQLVSYDGGLFAATSPIGANDGVLRWNGTSWTQPTGIQGPPLSLDVYDDGSGPALFVGMNWGQTQGADVAYKWNGSTLSGIGAALFDGMKNGSRLAVFDGGPTPGLYSLEGRFQQRWSGSGWDTVNDNGQGTLGSIPVVLHADLDGPGGESGKLYGAGFGNHGTATPVDWIEDHNVGWVGQYDGQHWSIMGEAFKYIGSDSYASRYAVGDLLKLVHIPSGPAEGLYVGGRFTWAGPVDSVRVDSLARWDGAAWDTVGSAGVLADIPDSLFPGVTYETSGTINDAVMLDPDGSGPLQPRLVVAGFFKSAGGVSANNIAQWDGSSWSALGAGVNARITRLAVADFGAGPRLIASGDFTTAGEAAAKYIASWDGSSWSPLGAGIAEPPPPYSLDGTTATIYAMEAMDDGNGAQRLVVAGNFLQAGGVSARHVASWDGATWSAMDAGLPVFQAGPPHWPTLGQWPSQGTFNDFIVWDDGTGPALYGISFNTLLIGNEGAVDSEGNGWPQYLGKWTGTQWVRLPYGEFIPRVEGTGRLVHATKDGDGPGSSLYVSGYFREVDGVRSDGLARWAPPPSECAGDLDFDGDTDVLDFSVFAGAFGTTVTPGTSADFDGDGDVDVFDFGIFASSFGCGMGPS